MDYKALAKKIFFSMWWLAPVLLIIDLATKWAVQLNLTAGQSVPVIENFFYITLIYNTGSAGGLGDGIPVMRIIYIIISWVMSGLFIYAMYKARDRGDTFLNVILAMCLGGAVGNLIDRTFYWEGTTGFSGVIDFFEFYLQGGPSGPSISWMSPFPIFNVADICLTLGLILFLVYLFVNWLKARKQEKTKDDEDLVS